MKAAEAMPLAKLSAEITAINACTSWPCPANHANNRLLNALSKAPTIKMRITPQRMAMTPPTNAPNSVMITPYTLVTLATSALV